MNHIVNQPKIHIFIHFCVLQHLTRYARTKEKVRLYVDIVPSKRFALDKGIIESSVHFIIFFERDEFVEFFCGGFGSEGVQFFEGDGFEAGAVGFLGVEYESNFGFEFGKMGSNEAFLKACAEYDVLWSGLVFGNGEGQLFIECIFIHDDSDCLNIN